MLWKTSLAVVFLLAGSVIGAEAAAPLEWKPSILLRASTGELPTRYLDLAIAVEIQKLVEGDQFIAKAQAEANALRQSDAQLRAALLALRERVEHKQAQIQDVQLR